jgi:hypothetical protein
VTVPPREGSGRLPRPEPEEHIIDVYFDFTCPYSRRTARWWRELDESARWRPFLLRESHREDDGARVSVLALALHEAVDVAGLDPAVYRWRAVDAFGVFGIPTLADGTATAYLKLAEQPAPDRARPVLDAVLTVLRATPEVVEIKRPG